MQMQVWTADAPTTTQPYPPSGGSGTKSYSVLFSLSNSCRSLFPSILVRSIGLSVFFHIDPILFWFQVPVSWTQTIIDPAFQALSSRLSGWLISREQNSGYHKWRVLIYMHTVRIYEPKKLHVCTQLPLYLMIILNEKTWDKIHLSHL